MKKLFPLYLITLACVWAIQMPLFAVVGQWNGIDINTASTLNGITPIAEINGIAVATPTATATATATAGDVTAPTLLTCTIAEGGEDVTLHFDEAVTLTTS